MKNLISSLFLVLLFSGINGAFAAPSSVPPLKKVFTIVFENINFNDAMGQPYFAKLAKEGASLNNFFAEIHPSQGNYIAMTAGNTYKINHDRPITLDVKHIGDLLEAKGKTWKVYAEQYPGDCFKGEFSGKYARKHVPFISYKSVQTNAARCGNLQEAAALWNDVKNGTVPDYSFYVPDQDNDGHDTDVQFADRWLERTFGPLIQNPQFMKDMTLILTFDEDDGGLGNHIYTTFYGDAVNHGAVSGVKYNHYNMLRTIEDGMGLGNLGQNDATAAPITGIWK